MIMEICMVAIAILLFFLVLFLIGTISKIKKSVASLQKELLRASEETTELLSNLNSLVQNDVHRLSVESTNLISKISDLTEDVKGKSESLSPLFHPLQHLSAHAESSSTRQTFPEFFKWLALSVTLFKTTRRFINYVK
jgi:uncharacterized protein YoxC